jgi:glutathione S-transferase
VTDSLLRLNQSRAQRIVWLLEELKLPYEVELFQRTSTFLAPPELEKIHPLGKSPIISVTPSGQQPIVLAESGFITSYLCEHSPEGKKLVPSRWKDGMEGQFGGETEGWLRHEYFLHYAEGTLMGPLVMTLLFNRKSPKSEVRGGGRGRCMLTVMHRRDEVWLAIFHTAHHQHGC